MKKYDHSKIEKKWPAFATSFAEASAVKKATAGQAEIYEKK